MTKSNSILDAGKQLAKAASGRIIESGSMKVKPEDLLNAPTLERQGGLSADKAAQKEGQPDPGNPNDINHDDQQPGQEKAGS